uniref:DNA-binding transcriptional regulator, LysR family n=1 Tax=Candidatus Kentrum sp. TUN TaxID=2126343 RepID=A0A450ZKW4_9GAMM|nr:MAG: DNA-binding transcriptional regulator, LysR family [Candidatus Kentron sp. TUN]VFK55297.1 MAG: DNA-binding transcriptional regulator, LysR family [Candidatus Kentron sp. TUN]VFK56662.1 MAG: DNA-binding transcriptional regulator, LysR family [Candidatus Kentron sp. TUN]
MSDRRLQVFHTVAKMLSFTKAAEVLHMTQPAVTFQVHQLEEHFNTRLFDRTHHRISLTNVGREVYEYSDRIFTIYAQMENRIRDITGNALNVLMLGASTTIGEYMLPLLLGNFKHTFPNATIRLRVASTNEIISMLDHNEIDLGVVEGPVTNENLVVELCCMDQLVVVAPPRHHLASRESITAIMLMEYPFIACEGSLGIMLDYVKAAGLDANNLNIAMELGSSEAIKGAIEAGMGISVLPRIAVMKELSLKTLTVIELDPPLEKPLSFVYRKQKFRVGAMDELLNVARSYCRNCQRSDHENKDNPEDF